MTSFCYLKVFAILCLSLAIGYAYDDSSKQPVKNEAKTAWYLKPVVRPVVPVSDSKPNNPIDAFLNSQHQAKGLKLAGKAGRRTLLRRVYLDLIGIPPTIAEQDAFLADESPDAYEKLVDRLLASEQHGVRYARHWLDVLRYADTDDGMVAAPGIHQWRDWIIRALNNDMPYDQFVCTQLTGYRTSARYEVSAIGFRERIEPRPDDVFALGFLSRGAVVHGENEIGELPINAVETVSSAFLGLTVGCAKCHDHEYDPIKQRDFYTMKALFDPLAVKKLTLANPAEVISQGKITDALDKKLAEVREPILTLIAPYKKKLLDERIAQLPAEVQSVIQKPEKDRTPAEEKIADDYFPILRIDVAKIMMIMPEDQKETYQKLVKVYKELEKARANANLPAFWAVEVDRKKELDKGYILTSGDPKRPELKNEVTPGWPLAPAKIDFRHGRIETFVAWLTAAENPLFARVAVNRLWQWHFGEGLQKNPSDFGKLGGVPSQPELLDWLASEFIARKCSMKAMHRLIVTSEAYKRSSDGRNEANRKVDPANTTLWHYPLRRLDAETVWDSIHHTAGTLDLKVGGKSFDPKTEAPRRGAYIIRGYANDHEVVPAFLQAFDVDDGRTPCPQRTHTVTAPQSLFLMNSDVINAACEKFANRLEKVAGKDLKAAVVLGYRIALTRSPSEKELVRALEYLQDDPARLRGLAWLLFNLDEFVFVR
ncbi:MAG TPA: DUF1549 and DUF1553 domain-containing protein [Gemmatales bacterium]|nr:DUF1549 and DUF1553 domain-containing protein [Gemmatales bacterium]